MMRTQLVLALALVLLCGTAEGGPKVLIERHPRPIQIPTPTIYQVAPWTCRRWTAFEVRGTGYYPGSRIWMQAAGGGAPNFAIPTTYLGPTLLQGRVPLSCGPGNYLLAVKNVVKWSNMSNFIVQPD